MSYGMYHGVLSNDDCNCESVVGMNSILLYLLHEILEGQIPFCGDECHFKVDSHGTRFAAQVGAITTWVLYSYYCHRRKFYLVI